MIKFPDKRKLVAYKLTRQDDTYYQFSPKDFTLYARESSTSDWVNLTSESLTASTPIGNSTTGGGTRYPSTGDLAPIRFLNFRTMRTTWRARWRSLSFSSPSLWGPCLIVETFEMSSLVHSNKFTTKESVRCSSSIFESKLLSDLCISLSLFSVNMHALDSGKMRATRSVTSETFFT